MIVVVGIAAYLGFAVLVGRFCSLSSPLPLGESEVGAGIAVDSAPAAVPATFIWPMEFPEQPCSACRRPVPWPEAKCEEVDGRLVAIRHGECA